MKYFTGFILVLILLAPYVNVAQNNDQRTVTTRIADVLAKFPSADKKQYDANVDQLQKLGADGLQQMIAMLSPEGKGDNTALEYAISAYSSSVMKAGGRERKTAVDVYCASLKNLKDPSNINFIIRQLQLVGNDESLQCLSPYLKDERQAGPAARAIAQVGTEAAGKLLFGALTASDSKDKASIIEALGYLRYSPAAPAIEAEFNKGNVQIKKVSGYALAKIGAPSSAKVLHDAAKSENFKLDNTTATPAYLAYLKELSGNDKSTKETTTLATELMTEAAAAKNTATRIAALTLLSSINKEKVQPLLLKAISDADNKYRGAALKLAEKNRNENTDKQWVSSLKKISPEARVQLINYLAGSENQAAVLAGVDDYLTDNNDDVRHAAINAIPSLSSGEQAVQLLTSVLKKNNANDFPVVKSALMRVRADHFGNALASQLDGLPPAAAAICLEVIASRQQDESGDKVFSLLDNKDTTISNAAFRALPSVVNNDDLSKLFELLGKTKDARLVHVQNALTAASAGISDTAARTLAVTNEMNRVSQDQQYVFAPTLASIGGPTAMAAVNNIFKNGNESAKKTVISALSKNKDLRSASMLHGIAKAGGIGKEAAVDGYISIIQRGNFPADQKVLMLQNAMELSTNDAQRKKIIREAGRNGTYQSLVFVGKYLDNSALQQDAAFAIMNVALAHPEFNGNYVRELLQKVSANIKGQDSQYQKEAIRKHLAEMPAGEGFVPIFNGKDLTGWKGLVEDPVKRAAMSPKSLADAQKKADAKMKEGWTVKDGVLLFTGKGDNLATTKQYEDFEMLVDWKITPDGDAGIYLRGTPQVQIWDTSRHDVGAQVGSGGLYNNEKNASKPLVVADNPIGEWNTFRIIMKGDKVTVFLNGQLVTDNVTLENYWNRKEPIFPREQIELQAHGTEVAYRNIYVKELASSRPFELPEEEKKENYELLFNGTNLDKWIGNKKDYVIDGNELVVKPSEGGGGGNLFTEKEYGDFQFRFEFMLTPGANNGLAIRAPLEGDAAYVGMELQILDNDAEIYKDLKPYQYHGSVYGTIAAKRGYLKPIGEWNYQEVIVKGTKIKVILNGTVILDGDIKEAREKGTADKQDHPGLKRDKGHIGFLGHGSVLRFRNIRVKEL